MSLGKTRNAITHLGPSSPPVVVAQPDERHVTEQLLCWVELTDHTTSGLNEEGVKLKHTTEPNILGEQVLGGVSST